MAKELIEGFRLSPQQEHLWRLQQSEAHVYRARCAVTLTGGLDRRLLEAALGKVVRRHEILRTAFHVLPGMTLPLQVIREDGRPGLRQEDLSDLPPREQEAFVEVLRREMDEQPFDAETGSPLRAALVKTAPEAHTLLLSLPALCADALGLKNLVGEIARSYAACQAGEEPPGEPMQYPDFSDWQHEILAAEEVDEGRSHWRQKAHSEPPALRLPLEKSAAGKEGFDPQIIPVTVSPEVVAKVEALAQERGVSLSTALLACFYLLLWRLTQQPDIVVAVGADGRNYEELETALGLFARSLPVRARLGDEVAFAELLRVIERGVREAQRWQEFFTWERGAASGTQAGAAGGEGAPYFPFSYEFIGGATPAAVSAGVRFTLADASVYTSRFHLLLRCQRRPGGGLVAEWHYDPARYAAEDVKRWAEGWQAALADGADRPSAPLDEVSIVGAEERARLSVEFNRTAGDAPGPRCVHELVAAQAARTPEAVALVSAEGQLSYGELERRANRLARHLRRRGVGVESRVAILLERGVDMVVALLGVLKAGGAYVPLDAEYPPRRLRLMLEDAGVRAVLTREGFRGLIEGGGAGASEAAEVIYLDAERAQIGRESGEAFESGATPDNLAYVIYTSGSTGRPKGVMISHRAICNRLVWMQTTYPMTAADSLLQKTPFSFDASVWEFFVPLLAGARLHLAKPGGQRDSAYLVEEVARHEITTLQLVPSMLRVVLDEPGLGECRHLRRVFCGGEALPVDLQERFFSRVSAELYNLYGPTETSIDATSHACRPASGQQGIVIGRPLANMQAYVLDARMRLAPVGVGGELHIGGVGLARGYLDRPGLTAERFIPDPFSTTPGARLYKTGDLARWLPDGTLEYLGRGDHQVKLRGFRIELGEIEESLCRQPGVQAAVAAVREDEAGHRRLVAYVVPTNKNALAVADRQLYRLPNHLAVSHLYKGETDLLYREIFEDEVYLKHGVTLGDGDCVFDVGANIGLFTLFVHQRCPNARVYAFEPLPPTFAALETNVNLYGLPVKAYRCGLSDEARAAEFTFYPRAPATSGMYADALGDEAMTRAFMSNQKEVGQSAEEFLEGRFKAEHYTCQLRTVSDIIRENAIEQIDLLKVDVEKSELDVLRGIEGRDWERIRQIVLEVHDLGGRLEEVTALLRKHGFELVVEQDALLKNTGLYNIYAMRPERPAQVSRGARGGRAARPLAEELAPVTSASELRRALEESLPDYMVPSAFVLLRELPRLPNGKVDRGALPAPEQSPAQPGPAYVAPRTETERLLAEVWAHVLGRERVGVDDNFFELGGDSILSIQVVARAGRAGLKLSPKQIFRHQTVAELAAAAGGGLTSATRAEQGLVTGDVPLMPAQHSFLEQQLAEPHHFNQSVLLEARRPLDVAALGRVVERLMTHHDALRLRLESDGRGGWRQFQAGAEAAAVGAQHLDLSGVAAEARAAALEKNAAEIQRSLNLERGPLARVALFEMGAGEAQRLLVVVHHLAVDGVSWRILLEDLTTGLRQAAEGAAIDFGPKTTSFRQWAGRLREYAQSPEALSELAYWAEAARAAAAVRLPLDYESEEHTVGSSCRVERWLEAEETRALLQEVPKAYQTQINDVLLTALAEALGRWGGHRRLAVDVEGHGREELSADLDLSRTVGWFTSVYPVVLDTEGAATPGAALRRIKEQLRRVPRGGIGYGVLRYLSEEPAVREQLRPGDGAQVSFNYLGQLDQVLEAESLFGAAPESAGPQQSERGRLPYVLEVTAAVSEGRLHMRWNYSARLHARATVEHLADRYMKELRELIAHCRSAEAGGFTPSDFPLAQLNQDELDLALSEIEF